MRKKKHKPWRALFRAGFLSDKTAAHRVLRFLIRFNLFAIPLYVALFLGLQSYALQSATTDIIHPLLLSTGLEASRDGTFLTIPVTNGQWGAFINWECTGWKAMLALFALVMATDFSLRKKLKGLAVLVPALYAVNIGRIAFMFHFVRAFDLAYYQFVHAVVWSWGLIFAILALWVLWMKFQPAFTPR